MKHLLLIPLIAVTGLVVGPGSLTGQADRSLLTEISEEEQAAIYTLVLYPEQTRSHILAASLHPEVLIKMESIQTKTRADFSALLAPLAQAVQEQIWDLVRYPELIQQLTQLAPGNEAALQERLSDYPEVIHASAASVFRNQYATLREVVAIQRAADGALEALLASYEAETQAHFRELIQLPEVVSLLTEHIRLTVLVGDRYRNEPARLIHQIDSLNREVLRNNARELEDWKKSLEENPEIAEELAVATRDYSASYAYDDVYYDPSRDGDYPPAARDYEAEEVVIHHYYHYPYPYWFGYPYWYSYPRWRPYPVWYEWGFAYRPGIGLTVIRLPSYQFVYWYFDHPRHHIWWPRLSSHFVRHYNTHRQYTSGITAGVTVWRSRNSAVVSNDWLRDDGRLTERLREYGEFESSRRQYNGRKPSRTLDQAEYLESKRSRYPVLSRSAPPRVRSSEEPVTRSRTREPVPARPTTPRTQPAPRTRTNPTGEEPAPVPSRSTRVTRGEEHHRNTVIRKESTRVQPPRTAAPRPAPNTTRSQPAKVPRTTKQPRKRSGGGTY